MSIFLALVVAGVFLAFFPQTRPIARVWLWSAYLYASVLAYSRGFAAIAIAWALVGVATFTLSQFLHRTGKHSVTISTTDEGRLALWLWSFALTLLLWPFLLAGRIADTRNPVEPKEPEPLSLLPEDLPCRVTDRISYSHHLGTDRGDDMLWLEAYGDQAFYITSELLDSIDLDEGEPATLSVELQSGEQIGLKSPVFWVVGIERG